MRFLMASLVSIAVATVITPSARATSLGDVCQAGVADTFSLANGSELPTPSALLQATVTHLPDNLLQNFDSCIRNRVFAHTLDGCAITAVTVGATLRLHLKGVSPGETQSDRLMLGVNGGVLWGMRMNTLQSLRTGGLDQTWSPGDSGTFVLNLAQLPPAEASPFTQVTWTAGVTSIIEVVRQAGSLDVLFHDDTCVDFLELEVFDPTPARSHRWGQLKASYR